MLKELLAALDDDQRAAVTAPLSNILCIANAGSGKTRVLVHRIAYWILKGQPEDSFLMLTFTNKAANEMMGRIKTLLGKEQVKITGGTFHSVAVRLLRRYGGAVGLRHNFQILDSTDAAGLIGVCREKVCADFDLSRKEFPPKEKIASFYSYCRNCSITLEERNEQISEFSEGTLRLIADTLVPDYEARKKKMNAVDFDDLLIYFDELLGNKAILRIIHNEFPNVFVDEYQDINSLQNSIIHKLAQGVNHLTVVGDEAQCIYGFRGSEVEFIQRFQDDYGNAGVFPIRNNYRSTDGVVDLALSVINQSPDYADKKKVMLANKHSTVRPELFILNDDDSQVRHIYAEIERTHKSGTPYSEMAILFRTGFLAKKVEAELTARGIPVCMNCGISFYERAHIHTLLDYLKLLANPGNEIAFWGLFETVDGIGSKTAKKMFEAFDKGGCDFDKLSELKGPRRAVSSMASLISAILEGRYQRDIMDRIDVFMNTYYKYAMMRLFKEDYEKRMGDIKILKKAVEPFEHVEDFLENITLSAAEDTGQGDRVLVTTVHKAKGLEWDKVILPYMNDGVYPHYKCEEREEERRLLYVAITRARESLTLMSVQWSPVLPREGHGELSPFLERADIETRYTEPEEYRQPQWAGFSGKEYRRPQWGGF